MIIFDTNAVNLLPPEGSRADFIRKLRQSKHHRVAIPAMVLEELAAHQAKFYPDKYMAVRNTLARLQEVLPWVVESSLEPLDLERLLDHWRGRYSEIFEVIETSEDIARRALAREAMCLPPAKRDKARAEGARDVAIWFSVLEFLKENPDEHVYFVTDNSTDFGDGTAYRYPMDEDVRGVEDRLSLLKDFDQVVSRFSTKVSGKDAEAAADKLLRSLSVRGRVAQTALEVISSPAGFVGLGAGDMTVEWNEWLSQPEVDLLGVNDVTGHEIEGDVWYTANATWLLHGLANDSGAGAQYVSCVWQMKVLFSARDEEETPTVLTRQEPTKPDVSNAVVMELLQRLKERVAGLVRRATQGTVSPAERHVSALRVAASRHSLDVANYPNFAAAKAMALPGFDIGRILGGNAAQNALAAALRGNPAFSQATLWSGIQPALDFAAADRAQHDLAAGDESGHADEEVQPVPAGGQPARGGIAESREPSTSHASGDEEPRAE
ncbi:PIN domain-containing protein [Streptomyces halstedii]|uniref:PIN domain-containing protein n=1 Tax=Streptomyces halstedii TaxID=1944 RepID=UPI0036477F32